MMRWGKLFASIAVLAGLAAGGFYYFNLPVKSPEGIYIFPGFIFIGNAADGPYFIIQRDTRGNPQVERPIGASWRLERTTDGRFAMFRRGVEYELRDARQPVYPDPQTGQRVWLKECVIIPSATVPGDWDVSEITPDPCWIPLAKLSRPLPSALHRVADPRVVDLIEQTAAVRDLEWQPLPVKADSNYQNRIYTQHPPLAQHDDLLGLAAAVAQAHPNDADVAMLRMDALIAARDFKTLETEIEKWRPVLEKPSFLRLPFHRAQAALRAAKLSAAGKNADQLMNRIYNPQSDLATRLRLAPEAIKYDHYASALRTVWPDKIPNFLDSQTTSKVMGVLANFMLFQGRRDEALRLLADNYHLGQLRGTDPHLINFLVGVAMRHIIMRTLGVYALNACATPQEYSSLWQWLEYLNAHEPPTQNPANMEQASALAIFQLDSKVTFYPEWLGSGMIEPNLFEAVTRANVVAAKFQLVRMGTAARAHQFASGRLPASAGDLAPLLPAGAPLDPFTSAPLRLATQPAGVTCYSVGPDRADDLGAITYDPSNGSDSRGDVVLEVPVQRQYPFPRSGVHARTPQDLLAQFPAGLPLDPFADTLGRPLGISNTSPVYVYSFGPDSDEHDGRVIHPQVAYDPTNGTSSQGDIIMQVPWQ